MERSSTGDGETADGSKKAARASWRSLNPNYFVTILITDKQTIKKLREEQADFLSRYPFYEDFRIREKTFHLTLTVLQLDSEADEQSCIDALNGAKAEIENLARKADGLTFQGLGSFGAKVIFAKVKFSNEFLIMVDAIRTSIKNAGIKLELKPLKAHVTLFKVDTATYRERGWYKGPLMLTSYFDLDPLFGSQPINNIQVCEMGSSSTQEDGFYKSIFNLQINE